MNQTETNQADGSEEAAVAALRRLYVEAAESGQVARFLLSLYNGRRYPFNLNELRSLDDTLYEDCIRVLHMDARRPRQEVHTYFANGSAKWRRMADNWRAADAVAIRCAAKHLAEQVAGSGPHAAAAVALLALVDGNKPQRATP